MCKQRTCMAAHTQTTEFPLVLWRRVRWEGGAAPEAIWQGHRHLHNVIFYLISHSKCNQKLMRALSCLADWQHDITLTPNTGALHPNDAILKPSWCSYSNTVHKCVCVDSRDCVRVCTCVSQRQRLKLLRASVYICCFHASKRVIIIQKLKIWMDEL